jgi:methionyl-tRNA formyltransferase
VRIVFAGTPAFAAAALGALADAGHEIPLVLTQPDRPAGRGMKTVPGAVKALAHSLGLPVSQPASLKDPGIQEELRAAGADVMVVAAYGLILPKAVLALPRHGCVNIHASLLPRWRGAAPIQRAILAGDAETGITIMQMDAGLDTGDILLQRSTALESTDTAGTLHDRLSRLGADCILEALERLARGELLPRPQPEVGATYAAKVTKEEAVIAWERDAEVLCRMVRAFNPAPGAAAQILDTPVKIWNAVPVPEIAGAPGEIKAADARGIIVACGHGGLRLEVLQRAGGRRMTAADFLSGFPIEPGARFQGRNA